MKEKYSHDHYKDILRVNRLLQSSLLEMRYHCEVYKLSLQCINKILLTNTTDLQALSSSHIIDDGLTTTLKYSAKSNYQRNLILISQKRALNKISVVLKKAKTYIKGYSLLETADSLSSVPFVSKESSSSVSQPVTEDSKKEDGQLNSGLLEPTEKDDLLQDSASAIIPPTNKENPGEECGCQKSNEISQDVVPNKSTLSSTKGSSYRDSGEPEGTLFTHKTSHASEVDCAITNENLGGKISHEKPTISQWKVAYEPQKYIRESSSSSNSHYRRKVNRFHGEINASTESNVTCNSPVRVNNTGSGSGTRKTRWDNGSQIALGKDRYRSTLQGRNHTRQTIVFKGNNLNKRNITSSQNTQVILKGQPTPPPNPPAKVDINFINFKRNQVLRKYENMRFASSRVFRGDGIHQPRTLWGSELHSKRGQIRNHKARGHEYMIGQSSSGFKGNNLIPVIQSSNPSLAISRLRPSAKQEHQRAPRIDVYPFSHEKIWELLPVSLNNTITQNTDKLGGLIHLAPPVAAESQGEGKLVGSIPIANPLVVPIPLAVPVVVEPDPMVVTHISTFLEDPRLKKLRDRSQVTGESGTDK